LTGASSSTVSIFSISSTTFLDDFFFFLTGTSSTVSIFSISSTISLDDFFFFLTGASSTVSTIFHLFFNACSSRYF